MLGSGWVALLSVAFIPIYIHFMGIESYGLVGFFVTLQILFSLMDMGLTATVSRELARLSALHNKEQEMRNVVRTLELVYWGLALLVALIVIASTHWIATSWVNSKDLSEETIERAVFLMGVVLAFRMPYSFYCGALAGMQKQVLLNGIKIGVETIRHGGVVIVLWLFSPTIYAYFLWHTVIAFLASILMFSVVWWSVPATMKGALFTPSIFRYLWKFVAGMSGISVLSLILMETDKVILSKMLTLDELGYYVLASTLAMGLNLIIAPIFAAIYPRFAQLVAQDKKLQLTQMYHKSCQLMTVLVFPLALVMCFFSGDLLQLWTQDATVASRSAPLLSILVIGTACNALMNIPYALQLAHAWTKLSVISNIIAIIVLIPALVLMISEYGSVGAATIWTALNVGYVVFNSPIIHAKLLKGEFVQWLVRDFGIPAVTALISVALFWLALPAKLNPVAHMAWMILALFVAYSLCALSAPMVRDLLWGIVTPYRSHGRENS